MEGINLKLRLLKSKRVLKGIYQHEIAKEIGISHKSYNFKENGKVGFNVDEILKVIECLDLTFDEVNDIFFFNKLPKS
jgi:DNA-binding XRE family transcriptional regulator